MDSNIEEMLSKQSRNNRDYQAIIMIHNHFKRISVFLNKKITPEKNREFDKTDLKEVEDFIKLLSDKYLYFYSNSVRKRYEVFLEDLIKYIDHIKEESKVLENDNLFLLKDSGYPNVNSIIKEIDVYRTKVLDSYDSFYFFSLQEV